jgi:hypothetical protein
MVMPLAPLPFGSIAGPRAIPAVAERHARRR